MEETIVSFKTAKLAKEKGFPQWKDLPAGIGMSSYDIYKSGEVELNGVSEAAEECITAPTQSLLQKWLREEHDIEVEPYRTMKFSNGLKYGCLCEKWMDDGTSEDLFNTYQGSYEEALEEGLYEALKLIP